MTSIVTVNPARNMYEQVKWKCRAYSSMFSTVLIMYAIIALVTGGAAGSIGRGATYVNYQEQYHSLDALFMLSLVMMLILGWLLASKQLSHENFSVVTTNRTEAISTALFLVVHSLFTLLAALSTLCMTVVIDILRTGDQFILIGSEFSFVTCTAFFVCILLAASLGYFVHVVFDFSKIMIVLLGAALFLLIRRYTIDSWSIAFGESSLSLISRGLIYIVVLWLLVILIRQRREVTRA